MNTLDGRWRTFVHCCPVREIRHMTDVIINILRTNFIVCNFFSPLSTADVHFGCSDVPNWTKYCVNAAKQDSTEMTWSTMMNIVGKIKCGVTFCHLRAPFVFMCEKRSGTELCALIISRFSSSVVENKMRFNSNLSSSPRTGSTHCNEQWCWLDVQFVVAEQSSLNIKMELFAVWFWFTRHARR